MRTRLFGYRGRHRRPSTLRERLSWVSKRPLVRIELRFGYLVRETIERITYEWSPLLTA